MQDNEERGVKVVERWWSLGRREMGLFCLKMEEALRMDPLRGHWCIW